MINKINEKVFDYIFSTNIGLKGDYLDNSDIKFLCSELNKLISEISDIPAFWDEHISYVNKNCLLDASDMDGREYIYNSFPKMTLTTKKEYLNYKSNEIRNSILNNGEFNSADFKNISKKLINVAKKELLDYCRDIGIISYNGQVFIAADNCPALAIIYDNIDVVLYTEEEANFIMANNMIYVSGNGNILSKIEQNNESNNNSEKLFEMVLNKLDLLEKDGVSKDYIEKITKACNTKEENKVIGFLKDIATGTISSVVASGILAQIGIPIL